MQNILYSNPANDARAHRKFGGFCDARVFKGFSENTFYGFCMSRFLEDFTGRSVMERLTLRLCALEERDSPGKII